MVQNKKWNRGCFLFLEYQVNGKHFAAGTHFHRNKTTILESLFCIVFNDFLMSLRPDTACRIVDQIDMLNSCFHFRCPFCQTDCIS